MISYAVFVPLSPSSTEFHKIQWKHRNSVEMAKFRGSAQNSAFRGKLWSLIINEEAAELTFCLILSACWYNGMAWWYWPTSLYSAARLLRDWATSGWHASSRRCLIDSDRFRNDSAALNNKAHDRKFIIFRPGTHIATGLFLLVVGVTVFKSPISLIKPNVESSP